MKRIISVILVVSLLVSIGVGVFGASALTKDDLYNKFVSKSKISHYVTTQVKNFVRANDFTEEQLTALDGILDEFLALNLSDKGRSGHMYTLSEMQSVEALISKACNVMNWTARYDVNPNPVHKGDITFKLFDKNGKLIFEYDGDIVSKTGELPDNTMHGLQLWALFAS